MLDFCLSASSPCTRIFNTDHLLTILSRTMKSLGCRQECLHPTAGSGLMKSPENSVTINIMVVT